MTNIPKPVGKHWFKAMCRITFAMRHRRPICTVVREPVVSWCFPNPSANSERCHLAGSKSYWSQNFRATHLHHQHISAYRATGLNSLFFRWSNNYKNCDPNFTYLYNQSLNRCHIPSQWQFQSLSAVVFDTPNKTADFYSRWRHRHCIFMASEHIVPTLCGTPRWKYVFWITIQKTCQTNTFPRKGLWKV